MKSTLKFIFAALLLPSSMLFSQAEEVTENSTQADSKNIFFTDSQNGYAADYNGNVIYKTTDGGISWLNQRTPSPSQIKSIIIGRELKNRQDKNSKKKKPVSGGDKDDINAGFMPSDDFAEEKNGLAEIKFSMVKPGFVSIKIYNSHGKTVDELARSSFGPGLHEIKWNASKFPGDVYYYSIVSNEFSETSKIIIAK